MQTAVKLTVEVGADHVVKLPDEVLSDLVNEDRSRAQAT
jgi:hypothetical protein